MSEWLHTTWGRHDKKYYRSHRFTDPSPGLKKTDCGVYINTKFTYRDGKKAHRCEECRNA